MPVLMEKMAEWRTEQNRMESAFICLVCFWSLFFSLQPLKNEICFK